MFPTGYSSGAQIAFSLGLAFILAGVGALVWNVVSPPLSSGGILGQRLGGYALFLVGMSFVVWALVGARPPEGEMARETVKVRREMFPRGYRLEAIVVFFVGLGFFLYGLATLVLTAVSPPSFVRAIPFQLLWGFIMFGFGGFLASWALIGGRRETQV